jgi:putative hydrolase of the HAD superfamily
VKGLLIDLDDTLVDDRAATRVAFGAFLAHHAPGADEAAALARWRATMWRHWRRYEANEITFAEQRRERVREFLGRALDDAEADAALLPYLHAYQRTCFVCPDVAAFLERTRAIPKVVVTNGERQQQLGKLARAGLDAHFVGVVTPMDCGVSKPHPDIFRAAVRLLGVPLADCVMVGDDLERDIAPARALGMRAFHVDHDDPAAGLLRALEAAL